MEQDSVLPEAFGKGKEFIDYHQEGFLRLNVSLEHITKFGNLLHTLTTSRLDSLGRKKFPEKGAGNDHQRRLQGAIFALGSKNANQDWKSHSACSIRESLEIFSESRYIFRNEFYKLFPEDTDFNDINKDLENIKEFYNYFSGIVHHQLERTVHAYRILEPEIQDSVDTLSDDSFEKIFKKFFVLISRVLDFYTNYGTN